jgi:hypothetical protein
MGRVKEVDMTDIPDLKVDMTAFFTSSNDTGASQMKVQLDSVNLDKIGG